VTRARGRSAALRAVLAALRAVLAALLLAGTGGGAAASSGATPDPAADFDPWDGIDRDGRIPKVEKPDDLVNPDRWRYIPEGRLKPGNVFQRFLVSSFIAPFFFRDTDVGVGGGVAITDLDFRQQRRQEFLGLFLSYTTEGQQSYTGVWKRWLHHREAEGGGIFQEERSFLTGYLGYENSLTRRYFGVGDETNEDDESAFSDQTAFARFGIEHSFPEPGSDWVGGLAVRGEWHDLGDGKVGGEGDTRDLFPSDFSDADQSWLVWLEGELRYDTRDSPLLPYTGFEVGAAVDAALLQDGGSVGGIFTLFGSKVLEVPPLFHGGGDADEENPPTDTVAFSLRTEATAGSLPFFALPSLGGSRTLRGFIAGRFRDDAAWHASAEYRLWVLPRGFAMPLAPTLRVERVGMALFADVGGVDEDWPGLFGARVHASAGVGLRLTLERSAPFRVDVGFSSEGVEVTARFGLAF